MTALILFECWRRVFGVEKKVSVLFWCENKKIQFSIAALGYPPRSYFQADLIASRLSHLITF